MNAKLQHSMTGHSLTLTAPYIFPSREQNAALHEETRGWGEGPVVLRVRGPDCQNTCKEPGVAVGLEFHCWGGGDRWVPESNSTARPAYGTSFRFKINK